MGTAARNYKLLIKEKVFLGENVQCRHDNKTELSFAELFLGCLMEWGINGVEPGTHKQTIGKNGVSDHFN
ncbi:hypothetical protein Lsai_0508 [Legionella sainthelensi]|uniref:Uncharacterized protein n=1 Tax=Legionella sainthelensi TaxID=28087 RepID=A0A0W0YSI8_9GAMM|nr:hypothetical protein Lsai_0508 [Legionella sainthelensi]VEH31190.1 Uncharacterised protein [Legionella sainthelensi]